MRIADCLTTDRPCFSFELFPPRNPEGWRTLYATIADLAQLEPTFISVTYGAGGSTRRKTVDLVARIKEELGIEAMAHLTCVGHSAAEIGEILDRLRDSGLENVLALRGDPPRGQTTFTPPPDGFRYARELVRFIRDRYDFSLGAAAYPEGHPEASSRDQDLIHLREKVDEGADFLVTQLFFDPADYFAFVERARALGIAAPIIPGVMPVTSVSQIERFTEMCGASIPTALRERLECVRGDDEAVIETGIEWAARQCRALLSGGAPGIHFYTLNRARSVHRVFESLSGR